MSPHPHPWLAALAGEKTPETADEQLAAAAKSAHDADWLATLDAPADEARRRRLSNLYAAQRPAAPATAPLPDSRPSALGAGPSSTPGSSASGAGAASGRRLVLLGLAAAAGMLMTWLALRLATPPGAPEAPPALSKGGAGASAAGAEPPSTAQDAAEQRVASAQPEAAARALAAQLGQAGVSAQVQALGAEHWLLDAQLQAAQRDRLREPLARQGLTLPAEGQPLRVHFVPI